MTRTGENIPLDSVKDENGGPIKFSGGGLGHASRWSSGPPCVKACFPQRPLKRSQGEFNSLPYSAQRIARAGLTPSALCDASWGRLMRCVTRVFTAGSAKEPLRTARCSAPRRTARFSRPLAARLRIPRCCLLALARRFPVTDEDVLTPFPHVPVDIVEAEGVRRKRPHRSMRREAVPEAGLTLRNPLRDPLVGDVREAGQGGDLGSRVPGRRLASAGPRTPTAAPSAIPDRLGQASPRSPRG